MQHHTWNNYTKDQIIEFFTLFWEFVELQEDDSSRFYIQPNFADLFASIVWYFKNDKQNFQFQKLIFKINEYIQQSIMKKLNHACMVNILKVFASICDFVDQKTFVNTQAISYHKFVTFLCGRLAVEMTWTVNDDIPGDNSDLRGPITSLMTCASSLTAWIIKQFEQDFQIFMSQGFVPNIQENLTTIGHCAFKIFMGSEISNLEDANFAFVMSMLSLFTEIQCEDDNLMVEHFSNMHFQEKIAKIL